MDGGRRMHFVVRPFGWSGVFVMEETGSIRMFGQAMAQSPSERTDTSPVPGALPFANGGTRRGFIAFRRVGLAFDPVLAIEPNAVGLERRDHLRQRLP